MISWGVVATHVDHALSRVSLPRRPQPNTEEEVPPVAGECCPTCRPLPPPPTDIPTTPASTRRSPPAPPKGKLPNFDHLSRGITSALSWSLFCRQVALAT